MSNLALYFFQFKVFGYMRSINSIYTTTILSLTIPGVPKIFVTFTQKSKYCHQFPLKPTISFEAFSKWLSKRMATSFSVAPGNHNKTNFAQLRIKGSALNWWRDFQIYDWISFVGQHLSSSRRRCFQPWTKLRNEWIYFKKLFSYSIRNIKWNVWKYSVSL